VVSLALHPGKDIIATGQMASKGKAKMIDIFVWQISTGQVLAHLNNFHRGAIRKLQFSPAGDKLLSIGEDEKNSVAIYDWASTRVLCSSPVDPDKVMDACWKDETEFATVGLKHVKFFNIQGINMTMSKGLYGASGVVPMISCAYAF
jgi:WD40 repeat protein